jgi:heme/copper-type cytochrome/quinol oxidase subunit 3
MTADALPPTPADQGHATSLGLSNEKFGMWTLIGSECLFFGALIATYLIYVETTGEEGNPTPQSVFDIPFTSVSTFVLLMSSVAMVLALHAIQVGELRTFRVWTLATALLGSVFLSGQAYEYTVFFAEGMTLTTSPFSSSFFVLTSFHGTHVVIGVLMLIALWTLSMLGRLPQSQAATVENIGLYWHFVDIVWILIFTLIYLIPAG